MSRIAVITSSTREGRFTDAVLAWLIPALTRYDELELEIVDLRHFDIPMFDGPLPASRPGWYATPAIEAFAKHIDEADGFIVLVAEYNHGYTGQLKNAIDHTWVEWHRKPIAFVGWGGVGGARAIEQLRLLAVALGTVPTREAVHILPPHVRALQNPTIENAPILDTLMPRVESLALDLAWWARVLGDGRAADAARHAEG